MDIIRQFLPAKPEYVSLARLSIASIANHMGFTVEDTEDLKVALSEACANAICHGISSEEETYELVYEIEEQDLKITVIDKGSGFDTESIEKPDLTGNQIGGGFGLYIINSLMDKVDILSVKGLGTSITMIKNLSDIT